MGNEDFALTRKETQPLAVQHEGVVARQTQEVQASMVIAKKFPRDEADAFNRIMQSCKRTGLAEDALYQYPRGGTRIEGPSIHLAKAEARAWGNINYGIRELEQRNSESMMEAYAWDLETNVRETRNFVVKHERKAKGVVNKLDDARDIYEMNANMGARRLRACILGLIPNDITDAAVEQCNKTLAGDATEPLADRVRNMVVAFTDLGVTQDMVERRLGYRVEAVNERDIVKLKKIYASIRDGIGSREEWFEVAKETPKTDLDKKFEEDDQVIKPATREPAPTPPAPPIPPVVKPVETPEKVATGICGVDSSDGRKCTRDAGHDGKHHYGQKEEAPVTPPAPVEKKPVSMGNIPSNNTDPEENIKF